MNKFFGVLILFLLSTTLVFSADMRFVQVDGLYFNTSKTASFQSLIEKINSERNVDFVVFSGNNISNPNRENLKNFLFEAKKLKKPYYVILGQKDVSKQKDLSKEQYMKIVSKKNRSHKKIKTPNYVFKKNNVIFVVADGSKDVIPTANGYYKEDVILWLDEQLDFYKDKNVVILQHYPIVPPIKKETHYTYKADEYLRLLTEHNNVKAVVAGHFGANNEQVVNGILHISTKNAPTYRIIDILDYDTSSPTFWSTIKE